MIILKCVFMRHLCTLRTTGILLALCFFCGLFAPLSGQDLQEEKESFDLAQRLFDDKDYANAAQEFRRFIVSYPTNDRLPTALLRLGEAHFRSGEYQEAVSAFQDFLDRYPRRLEVATTMRRKAEALLQMEEYTKAGVAFQEVHDAFTGGEYAAQDLLSAGYNYHRGENLDAAESAFGTLLTRYPQSPLFHEAVYNLGLVLLDAGRTEEALGRFRTIFQYTNPTERKPDALLEIGKIALNHEDEPEAQKVFQQLRTGFPRSNSAELSYLVMASWYERRGTFQKAADTYSMARQNLPQNQNRQQAVLGLANTYRKLGKNDEARALYRQFLEVYTDSPFQAPAWLGLGRAYADLEQYQEALRAFSRLQEKFANTQAGAQAFSDIGDIWRKLKTPSKALTAYRAYADRAETIDAKASARLRIARTYEEDLDWYDRARSEYEQLLETAPSQYAAEALFGLARTFEKTGQPNLAIREYRSYLHRFSSGPRAISAEKRIQYLREFAVDPGASTEIVALLADLPVFAENSESMFRLGTFLYTRRSYHQATGFLSRSLSGETPPPFAPEAAFLLAEAHAKLARKARLEDRPEEANSWNQKSIEQYHSILSGFPDSDRADDAALALLEAGLDTVATDSARARILLSSYVEFQKTYPQTDRMDMALLRTADAYRLLGASRPDSLQKALQTYRSVSTRFPESPLKAQAAYGVGLCQALLKTYIEAEETLRTFLFHFPQSDLADHAQFQLGRILLERGFAPSAAEELSELLTAPSSLELERQSRALLAESYTRMGDYPRAIQIDVSLLERGAQAPVLRRLARAYRQNGQPEKAIEIYATFQRNFPNVADADSIAFARAELLSQLNRTTEAIAAFQDFAENHSDSPLRSSASQTVGDLLFRTEQYENALASYKKIPAPARNESVAGNEVLCLYRLKNIKEAEQAAREFKKTYKEAHDWLARFDVEEGKYYLRAGNHGKARKIFEDVIKNNASTVAAPDAAYYRVQALKKEGKPEDHLNALATFFKQYPDNQNWPDAALELADIYNQEEDYARASRAYQGALASNALSPEKKPAVLVKMVEVHRGLKLYDMAISYARQLVREFPRDNLAAEARIDIGIMLSLNRDYAQAVQEIIPLLKLTQGNQWSLLQYTVAESYYLLADYESAKREYLRLQYDNQGVADWIANAHDGLAKCYIAQGNYREAIQELEKIQQKFGSASPFGVSAGNRIKELQSLLQNAPQSVPNRR
ncbi:MAG: tetratricopeptide repeat protein [bacterium]|nr:tetratricopeptide repeat protein [bacterium]